MTFHFLGTGDAFGSGGLDQTCFLVSTNTYHILIDCGCTALTSLKRNNIVPETIDAIIISHLHGDHFGGIPFFIRDQVFAKRRKPLLIVGPPEIEERVSLLTENLFPGSNRSATGFNINYQQYNSDRIFVNSQNISIESFKVNHVPETNPHAVRLTIEDKIICYSGDTTWTDSLLEAANAADLFICEAYTLDKPLGAHITYQDLSQFLKRIGCKKIYLTHCRKEVLQASASLEIEIAKQGMVINL